MSPIPLGILAASGGAPPVAAGDYDLLETTILSSSQSSVSFTNLSSTYGSDYKHLQVRMTLRSIRSGAANNFIVYVNGQTSSVYGNHNISGNGSGVNALALSNTVLRLGTTMNSGAPANEYSATVVDFLDAFSTSKNTTARSLNGSSIAAEPIIYFYSGAYFNTSAVNSLEFTDPGVSWSTGCRFSLYGIKAG